MVDNTPFPLRLSPLKGCLLYLRFDAGVLSSNGGALILREIERKLGIAGMMAIAFGYEDRNDLDTLRHGPALKVACERLPEAQVSPPSQPTLSRFENLPDWRALVRRGQRFIDLFCDSCRAVPSRSLPCYSGRPAFALPVSMPAQHSLALRPAWSLSR